MQSTFDLSEVERTVVSILPDEDTRQICLNAFLESAKEADTYGSTKWGAYYTTNLIRLLVGRLIVLSVHRRGVWLALDKESLAESKSRWSNLELSRSWQWDLDDYPEYTAVPSKNGYYFPGDDHEDIWPDIQSLHFELIRKTAKKYKELNTRSQSKHAPELLEYLRVSLGAQVPTSAYGSLISDAVFRLPEEIPDDASYFEGSKKSVTINAYERNAEARQKCIAHYGTSCSVCGFDFAKVYGKEIIGEGYIHVHHLTPLAKIGEEYEVNPVEDMRPVCPNCHAVIHRQNPPYSIEKIRESLKVSEL